MNYCNTIRRTTSFHGGFTIFTLDKKQMTAFVDAIGMHITRFATLMALRHNIVCDSFAQAVIKNKIFAYKFTFQTFCFNLSRVFNNSAFKLIHVFKTFVFKIGAGFFASNAASAIHQEFFILFVLRKLRFNNRQTFSKSIHIGFYGFGKMANFTFIMIAHINHNGIWIFE